MIMSESKILLSKFCKSLLFLSKTLKPLKTLISLRALRTLQLFYKNMLNPSSNIVTLKWFPYFAKPKISLSE